MSMTPWVITDVYVFPVIQVNTLLTLISCFGLAFLQKLILPMLFSLVMLLGQHCETEISSHICENNPCQNNGSCQLSSGDRYECTCMPGFTGVNCEVNINECQSNPCQHGGTCIDGINNYTCLCSRTGYVITSELLE